MDTNDSVRRAAAERVAAWVAAVERVEREHGWIPVDPAEIPAHVCADSQYWCDRVLAAGLSPHDATCARRFVHAGEADMLRHDYTAAGMDLTIVESRNSLLVRVSRGSLDLTAIPEADRPAVIARTAAALFRAPLRFCHCDGVREGELFCTDFTADPALVASWAERADGVVAGGALWFVCYKRVSQLVGFANPSQWFSDAARCLPRARRRSRRKAR